MKGKRDSQEQGRNIKSKLIRLREDKTQGSKTRNSHIKHKHLSESTKKAGEL